jgi:2-polyprenyl-6-methoxyphenol hydroxylase-like FAD-dependent oxidoreductase
MPDADVIVVGFRCAGAPLAYALHKAGVKVIVVDKDPLFADQPMSTHAIQPFGMKILDQLGLGDLVRDLAPPNSAFRFQVEDSFLQIELNGTDLDSRSPRRCMTRLLTDGDRVVGVRLDDAGREYELRAPLVVGADGRNSTIAKLVGAATYLE